MITAQQCATFAGLASNEVFFGRADIPPAPRLVCVLPSRFGDAGPREVREIIVADIRVALSLAAVGQAADLMIVLRELFSEYPEASLAAAPRRGDDMHMAPLAEHRSKLSSRRN